MRSVSGKPIQRNRMLLLTSTALLPHDTLRTPNDSAARFCEQAWAMLVQREAVLDEERVYFDALL